MFSRGNKEYFYRFKNTHQRGTLATPSTTDSDASMDQAMQDDIQQGDFEAIVLDTSVFDAQQLRLETGLLRRVAQFHDGAIRVLLPDVIAREVEAHLLAAAKEAQGALQRAVRLARNAGLLEQLEGGSVVDTLLDAVAAPATADSVAHQRLQDWIGQTGADVLRSGEHVSLDEVMLRYFDAKPPFSASGDKKHEFPDAIALLTLERWAEQQNTKVLAVSADGDWQRYGAQSARIVVVKDLTEALGAFQQHTARYACRRVGELLGEGDPIGLTQALEQITREQLAEKLSFGVYASSPYDFEQDRAQWSLQRIALPDTRIAARYFSAVDFTDGVLVIHVTYTAHLKVTSTFRYFDRDAQDQRLDIGIGTVVSDEQVELEALVSLDGKIPDHMTVKDIEILPASHLLELGDIKPDVLIVRGNHDIQIR